MARWTMFKDGDEVSVYRNGRNRRDGFASFEAAYRWIIKTRKYKREDKITRFDTGK